MGYDTTLSIGPEHGFTTQNEQTLAYELQHGRSFGQIVRLDLGSLGKGPLNDLCKAARDQRKRDLEAGEPKYGFYSDALDEDGNEILITEDRYGEPVAAIPLEEIRDALGAEEILAGFLGQSFYRRLRTLKVIVEDLLANYPEPPLYALTYGH